MQRVSLSGAEFFDLLAGCSLTIALEDGSRAGLHGSEFTFEEMAHLAAGETLEVELDETYFIRAPEEADSSRYSGDEVRAFQMGPYGPRLALLEGRGAVDLVLGPRGRVSSLAQRL